MHSVQFDVDSQEQKKVPHILFPYKKDGKILTFFSPLRVREGRGGEERWRSGRNFSEAFHIPPPPPPFSRLQNWRKCKLGRRRRGLPTPRNTKNASSSVKKCPNWGSYYKRASKNCQNIKNGAFFKFFCIFYLKRKMPHCWKMPFFPEKALKRPVGNSGAFPPPLLLSPEGATRGGEEREREELK